MSFESHKPATAEATKRKIALVETEGALEAEARDMAEDRLTASKEELRGLKGFFSKIWKHNLAREYYRQREIAKSKAEILESRNLYAGETDEATAHAQAMSAVVDRFVSEYEDTIHTDAGEERRTVDEGGQDARLNESVRTLVREYASGAIDDEAFNAERSRILAYATGLSGEELASAVRHTDNLFEIARQAKQSFEHGVSLEQIDQEIEIVVGKAKMGVRTEANMNTVDRIVAKVQASKIGRFLNETTIATGVAIAYSATVGISQRLASSRAFAWGTFGASALVGGAIAGMRESVKVEEERRHHSRDRAKGKEIGPDSERREEMDALIYKSVPARTLIDSLSNSPEVTSQAEYLALLDKLAVAESRILKSDAEEVDLISYTDFASIERERLELDIARAQLKIKLRSLAETEEGMLPKGETFDDLYTSVLNTQKLGLEEGEEGMEAKDKLFQKMKRRKIAGAVTKAVLTGVAIGGVVQEAGAFFDASREGLVEHVFSGSGNPVPESVTALEGVRRWISGEEVSQRAMQRVTLPGGLNVELPKGIEITPNPLKAGEFLFTKDGNVLSDSIQFENGIPTSASESILREQGVLITHSTHSVEGVTETQTTAQGFVEKNPDLFEKIHRKFWYDNNTAAFDKNELKLHWGGEKGTGIDANGNYVFNVARMTPDGSAFKDLSIDAQEKIAGGKLKMLLSLSKDSQSSVVEVAIDAKGNAVIDPKSAIGKMFFSSNGGQLKFLGKFAEVAHEAGLAKDGGKQFEILATHVGDGVGTILSKTPTITDVPVTHFGVHDGPYVEPPFFIPVHGRRPLEPMASRELTDDTSGYYYSNENVDYGLLDRQQYRKRMSEKILNNKEMDLSGNDSEIIRDYLDAQDKTYVSELEALISGKEQMHKDIETVITIPAYCEGKVLEKTLRNYAKLKGRNTFELVILENHSVGTERDDTKDVIERIQSEFPDLNITHLYKVFDKKPTIGEVRKYLVDAVLLRKDLSGIERSVGIVSNDADLEGISENYANEISATFKGNKKVDAIAGKWDFPEKDFERFPLLHASQRLWHYLDIAFRHNYLKAPELIGRNSAFRSGIYAAVGGYNKNAQLAEDLEIGWLIKEARGHDAGRIKYSNASWLISNSRRAVVKLLSGGRLIQQYGDFHVNETVRGADLEELLKEKHDFKIEDFTNEVNSIYEHYARWKKSNKGWVDDTYIDDSFDRAMRFLGAEYRKTDDDKIEITNISKLAESLQRYPDKAGGAPQQKQKTSSPNSSRTSAPKNAQASSKNGAQTRSARTQKGPVEDEEFAQDNGNAEAAEARTESERLERESIFAAEMSKAVNGEWEFEQSRFSTLNGGDAFSADDAQKVIELYDANIKALDSIFEREKTLIQNDTWKKETSALFVTGFNPGEKNELKHLKNERHVQLMALFEQRRVEMLMKKCVESFTVETHIIKSGRWDPSRSFFGEILRSATESKQMKETAQNMLNDLMKAEAAYVAELSQIEREKVQREYVREESLASQGRWDKSSSYFSTVQRTARFKKFDDLLKRDIQSKVVGLEATNILRKEARERAEQAERARAEQERAERARNGFEAATPKSPIEKAREILGLSEDVTYDEAKKAFRRFASKNHPDKNGKTEKEKKEGEEKMKELNQVWPQYEEYLKARK